MPYDIENIIFDEVHIKKGKRCDQSILCCISPLMLKNMNEYNITSNYDYISTH